MSLDWMIMPMQQRGNKTRVCAPGGQRASTCQEQRLLTLMGRCALRVCTLILRTDNEVGLDGGVSLPRMYVCTKYLARQLDRQ